MTVESAADRLAFLADFGVPVQWAQHGEVVATFTAVFDRPTVVSDGLAEAASLDRVPTLCLREADLPANAAEDDAIVVDGDTIGFACRTLRPDGAGMCIVDLKLTPLDSGGFHYVDGESPAALMAAIAEIQRILAEDLWTV